MQIRTSEQPDADNAALARVKQATADASGLPNHMYTGEEHFRYEAEALFARSWTCIGTGASLPRKGYARPIDFLGVPLLLVRDHDDLGHLLPGRFGPGFAGGSVGWPPAGADPG